MVIDLFLMDQVLVILVPFYWHFLLGIDIMLFRNLFTNQWYAERRFFGSESYSDFSPRVSWTKMVTFKLWSLCLQCQCIWAKWVRWACMCRRIRELVGYGSEVLVGLRCQNHVVLILLEVSGIEVFGKYEYNFIYGKLYWEQFSWCLYRLWFLDVLGLVEL